MTMVRKREKKKRVAPVVEPLSFVLETVRSFANSEPAPFVVLPFPHVRLRHVGVKHLVLHHEAGLAALRHDGGPRVVRLA